MAAHVLTEPETVNPDDDKRIGTALGPSDSSDSSSDQAGFVERDIGDVTMPVDEAMRDDELSAGEDADLAFIDRDLAGDPPEDEDPVDEEEGDDEEAEDDGMPPTMPISASAGHTPAPGRPNPEPDPSEPQPAEPDGPGGDGGDGEERRPGRDAGGSTRPD